MEEQTQIDQDYFSRQIAVLGLQTQLQLMKMRVFLHGLSGVGIQIAKNIILMNPKVLGIYDQQKITIQDLGRNFYAKQWQIGKLTRAQASISDLKDLNSNVDVNIAKNDAISFIIDNYDCVVVADNYQKQYLIQLNQACRNKGIGFILTGVLGLYGYIFVDFGNEHTVLDTNGEYTKQFHIINITQEETGLVSSYDNLRHGFSDGDTVIFKDVQGMTEINGLKTKIKVKNPYEFYIGDTRQLSPYTGRGIVTLINVSKLMKFNSFQKSLKDTSALNSKPMPICNQQSASIPYKLHIILNAIYIFYESNKRLPRPLNEEDAQNIINLVTELIRQNQIDSQQQLFHEQIQQKLIRNVCYYALTQISPCCSFWGGIVANEIIKLTGKFQPLNQWLHHEFFDVLPDKKVSRTLINSQSNDINLLFGDQFIQKAQNSRSLIIGAGGLGCQFIKMFAMMGIAVKDKGKVFCTDDDNIELTNLNNQFLFRKSDIGKNKSQIACKQGKNINPNCKFESFDLKYNQKSQQIFDIILQSLDFVVSAVDNIKTREYIDRKCIEYEKPVFESGIYGTKCHSQIIIPYQTISYTDISDPIQPRQFSFDMSTWMNFPYNIQHAIQFSKYYFQKYFETPSTQLVQLFQQPNIYFVKLRKQFHHNPYMLEDKLKNLVKFIEISQSKSYQNCVQMAVNNFQQLFYNRIVSILHQFPRQYITQETGKLFWKGLKTAPIPIQLDLSNILHREFIKSSANIFSFMLNIQTNKSDQQIAEIGSKMKPIKFKILEKRPLNEQQELIIEKNRQQTINKLLNTLKSFNLNKKNSPKIVKLNKDHLQNIHFQFIKAITKLRAKNYKINQISDFQIKLLVTKMVPAIITVKSMIVGAIGIQIIKLLCNKFEFKNLYANLSVPSWVFHKTVQPLIYEDKQFDPLMCGPVKVVPGNFNKWNKINIKGPITLQELKNHFQQMYKIQVFMITYKHYTLFSSFSAQLRDRLPLNIETAIESITKKEFPKWKKSIMIGISGNIFNEIDCLIPDIKYYR